MRTFTKHILSLALLLLVAVPTYALSPIRDENGTTPDLFLWFVVIGLVFMSILLGLLFIAI
ncbi:MAG: hypothetical protein ACOVQA_12530, partial [Thermoflexibacteraceae bacterium]